jgi:Secretion system C-terminal sorting domain
MRTLISLLILVITPFFGVAQRISPQVTNLAGFDLAASGQVITVSIGEPAIATFISTDFILTQGFLQPEILPCKEFKLTYYPNPTPDDMIVEALGCDVKIEAMQLIDVWGRVITTMTPAKNNKVQLGDISPGAYFIKVFFTNSETETIKIAKVSN